MPGRHSRLGLQVDHRLEHLERRRIGRRWRGRPCRTPSHLGKALDDLVLRLQQLGRLGHRHARQRGRHVEERALVERRHELAAEPAAGHEGRGASRAASETSASSSAAPARSPAGRARSGSGSRVARSGRMRPRTNSSISTGTSVTDSSAAPAMAKVLVNASGANSRPPAPPARTPAGRDGDDQQREEQRRPDLLARGASMARPAALAAAALEVLVGVLDHHDAASTIAPMAMAMPPRLMMLELMPSSAWR
jgi:hypothetical protein